MTNLSGRYLHCRKINEKILFFEFYRIIYFIWFVIGAIYDVIRINIFRYLFVPKKPSWIPRFELVVSITKRLFISFPNSQQSLSFMRKFVDTDVKSRHPNGVTIEFGEHLGNDLSLPSYEWIFSTNETLPILDENNKYNINKKFIIYYHGGGFVFGTAESYHNYTMKLAKKTGLTILVINYRRSPEYSYPIPDLDCYNTYQWLSKHCYNPSKQIILMGDSAGGALTLNVMLRIRDNLLIQPKKIILLSPWVDFFNTEGTMITNRSIDFISLIDGTFARYYLPENIYTKDIISPIYQNYNNIHTSIYIEYGECEAFYDQITEFIKKIELHFNDIKIQSKVYIDMIHAFQLFHTTKQPQCLESFDNINNFLNE